MVTARRETAIVLVRDLAFAYVEGRKAQTRRVVKLSDPSGTYADYGPDNWPLTEDGCGDWSKDRCPYGVPGDRLRMLTGWATEARFDEFEPSKLPADARIWSWFDGRSKPAWAGRLRVGRHLPKRLRESMPLAELVSVRVERLNEISEADAIAEGMLFHNGGGVGHSGWRHDINYGFVFNSARKAFAICWDACTPKHPWLSNPFVWVVEFKRMEAKR